MSSKQLFTAFHGALVGSFIVTAAACGQDPTSTDEPLPDLGPIMKQVAEIRGLEFKKDVPAEKQSIEDFRKFVVESTKEEYPAEMFDNIMDGLVRLGMLKEKIDLEGAFIDAITSQAGAYYDPESGKFFYLMTNMPAEVLNTFASHELVHALQDQYFGLKRVQEELMAMAKDSSKPRNDDYLLAVRCLIEGEATYVMTLWQMKSMTGMDLSQNRAGEEMAFRMAAEMDIEQLMKQAEQMQGMLGQEMGDMAAAMESMEDIPPYILAPLYSAYMSGAYFTMKLRHAGGWERVAEAWKQFPASTELCLHPDKWVGDQIDMPTPVVMPEFSFMDEAGWERIDSATHGEFYLKLLLDEHGVKKSKSKSATMGWDGDVYHAYRNAAGDVAIVLATTWDSENDANEFYDAYREALQSKYAEFSSEDDPSDSTYEFSCGEGLGEGVVAARNQEVFVVEGVDRATASRLLDELKAMPVEHVGEVHRDEWLAAADAEPMNRLRLNGLSFDVPQKWVTQPTTSSMRAAQFTLPAVEGDAGTASLVVYYFGEGGGGGIEANMARWTGQFKVDKAPARRDFEVNGFPVAMIDITGDYVAEIRPGAGDRVNETNWRMLATVVETKVGPYYFKLVGPQATVTRWSDAFDAMIDSIGE